MAEIQEFLSKKAEDQINKYEKTINNLVVVYSKLSGEAQKLDKKQKEQVNTQKELDNQTKAYNNLLSQLNSTSGKLQVAESGLNKELIRQKEELAKVNKTTKEAIKAEKDEVNSINALKRANKSLKEERDSLSTSTVFGRDRINEINAEIEKNTSLINDNSTAQEKARDNVGNYEESIRSALDAQNAFSGGAKNIVQNFISISQQEGGLKSFFKSAISGIGGVTKAGLTFIATPIGAIIAAIVVVIAALTNALSKNQGFLDKFNEVMAGLTAVFDNIIGRIGKFVTALAKLGFAAITGDIEGMSTAANDAAGAFDGMGESIKRAFEEGQAIERLRQSLRKLTIETTTSLEKLRQETDQLQTIADDATRSFKEREDAAEKARGKNLELFQTELDLARRREEIIVRENKLKLENGELTDELRQKEADVTKERIAAEGALLKIQLENEKTRKELIQDRLERDLDILIDGFDNVKTINEKIIANESETFEKRKKILEQTRNLAKDSFDEQIKTIREFTKVKFDENELLATQDAKLLNERIRNLGLSEVIEGRLLEIIKERRIAVSDLAETERSLNDSKVADENRRAKESADLIKEQLKQQAEADEIEQERLDAQVDEEIERDLALQAVKEEIQARGKMQREQNFQNIAQLAGRESELNKFRAVKQATIDGYAAVQSAYKDTPGPIPIKIAAGVAMGFIQLNNLRKIISTDAKIAAFADGTESTPSGTWLAGEEGRELKVDKFGNMKLINTPTLFNNEAGSKIFSNPDTERILRGDMPNKRSLDTEKIVGAIRENRSQMNVMLDKYGIINISRNGRNKTKLLNSKFRNKA